MEASYHNFKPKPKDKAYITHGERAKQVNSARTRWRNKMIAGVLEAFNTQRTPSGVYGDRVRLKAAHGGDTGRRPTGPTNRIPGTGTRPPQQGRMKRSSSIREAIKRRGFDWSSKQLPGHQYGTSNAMKNIFKMTKTSKGFKKGISSPVAYVTAGTRHLPVTQSRLSRYAPRRVSKEQTSKILGNYVRKAIAGKPDRAKVREAIIDRILEMGVGGVGSVSMSMGTPRVQSKPKTPPQPPVRPQRPLSKRIPY